MILLTMTFLPLKGIANKMVKRILVKCKLGILLSFIVFLAACSQSEFEFTGEHPELFSVALSSILGAQGNAPGPVGGPLQPTIHFLEEDDYGRILFSYSEGNFISSSSLVIMQRTEGNYVYFYPHYNFISSSVEYNWEFTDEDIEALKVSNSWNRALSSDSEFVRARIIYQKEVGPISREALVEVYYKIFPNDNDASRTTIRNVNSRMIFLRTDNYGRAIYVGSWIDNYIVTLFQPDHSFDLATGTLEISDVNRYQTELRLFMETNGWNAPFDFDKSKS